MQTVAMDKQRIPRPTTSLVGREEELARLTGLLLRPDVRLVTLMGPGGVGKTRLALQIAHEINRECVGDVIVVPLANITDGEAVLPAIARAVGASHIGLTSLEQDVADAIGEQPMLLILDNVEQISGDLTLLSDLLGICPNLTVMVTSRTVLRLSAEHVFPVEPLPTTSDGPKLLAPATALFVERAQTVHPDLSLTRENIEAVDDICRKVDGLPLAIELAAARTRFFSPTDLRDRLTERLSMLTGGPRDAPERHRTLRATLTWSHDLLTSDERMLFRRLAVAIDGIPYDAVEPICNSTGDLGDRVEDLLSGLVDHSLVRIDNRPETGSRVRLLHTIREFAQEQLQLSGELEISQRSHVMWYARMVIETPTSTWGTGRPELRLWTLRHLPDRQTFSTVLNRLMAWGETSLAVQVTAQLISFWNELGQMREAQEWCERVLPYIDQTPPSAQADLYFKASMIAHVTNKMADALDYGSRSLELYEQLHMSRSVSNAQNLLGNLYWQIGNLEEGERFQRLAIATTETDKNPLGAAMFKSQLADRLVEQGNYEIAEQMLDEARPIIARDRAEALPLFLGSQAILYLQTGRLDKAGECLEQSLVYHQAPPHRRPDMLSQLLMHAAELAAHRRMGKEGVRLLGASDRIVETIGLNMCDRSQDDVDRIEAALGKVIDRDHYNREWRTGHNLSTPDAIDLALSVARVRADGVSPTTGAQDSGLTRREWEVLMLLVSGKSNAAIAEAMFISERTVTTHLTRLYAKLNVISRAEAISTAHRLGLIDPS